MDKLNVNVWGGGGERAARRLTWTRGVVHSTQKLVQIREATYRFNITIMDRARVAEWSGARLN